MKTWMWIVAGISIPLVAVIGLFGGFAVAYAVHAAGVHQAADIEPDVGDFVDHTAQYKGKTITLRLTLWVDKGTLRDHPVASFGSSHAERQRLDLKIDIPKTLDVPNARFADELTVTFVCKDGDLLHGNEATAIRR